MSRANPSRPSTPAVDGGGVLSLPLALESQHRYEAGVPRVLDYNATVTRREEITTGLAVFAVELDEPLEDRPELGSPFVPGQYVTIGMNRPADAPDDSGPQSVLRPMTIASPPSATSELEFYIRYIDKPESRLPLTHLMWTLGPGGRLFVRPSATGHFTEPDTLGEAPGKNVLMVADGTGLAPFLSILRDKVDHDADVRLQDRAVLYGVSNPAFLGYHRELETYAAHRGLHYLPTVARPHESPEWEGSFGKIPELLADDRIEATEARLGMTLRPDQTVVLVCGLGPVIAGVVKSLLPRGYLPGHRRLKSLLDAKDLPPNLFYEQYDTEPLFELKDEHVVEALRTRWRPPS